MASAARRLAAAVEESIRPVRLILVAAAMDDSASGAGSAGPGLDSMAVGTKATALVLIGAGAGGMISVRG